MGSIAGLVLLFMASPETEKACSSGDANACQAACKEGSDFACVLYARHQALGRNGLKTDVAAARKTLESYCGAPRTNDLGKRQVRAYACGVLGSLVGAGIVGGKKDLPRAKSLFEIGCTDGDPLSCESLGGIYGGYAGEEHIDFAKSLRWYERGCELQNGRCCQMAGAILGDGATGKKDPARSAKFFGMACEQDLAPACGLLAKYYATGQGVKKDAKRAATLSEKACRLGYQKACSKK